MSRRFAVVLALMLGISSSAVFACPGDKAKGDAKTDSGQMSKPKPAT